MPQATSLTENHYAQSNVVALTVPSGSLMTSFMFAQATQAAQTLPSGWFTVALVRDARHEERRDHVMIARIAGPPVGGFEIWRGARGRFCVFHKGELSRAAESEKSGPYRTIEAAMGAIRADIDLQMEAWGVTPVPQAA